MNRKEKLSILLITSFAMMVVALYNGFGLTEGDTGAYIEKGILNVIPNDRSPFYGWFIRYTSLWVSLWFTLFAQCALLSWLLLKYIAFLQKKPLEFKFTLFTIITIVSFTCVAWVAGYLMPDIFAGILLLSVLLYLTTDGDSIALQVVYTIIIFLAVIIHNSHFLITGIFSFALILWAAAKKNILLLKRSIVLLILSVMGWVLICSINAASGNGFTLSRGSHVFMITKFAETGILTTYLNDNCSKKELKLCNYKEQIPVYSWDFLWDVNSPLYKTGGWDSNKTEYSLIIHDVFTTPKYIKMFAINTASATLRELTQVQAPQHTTFQGKWSSPWQRVGTYFSDELNEYCQSKQYTEGLSAACCNYIYYLFFILSTLWILFNPAITCKKNSFIYGCILLFFVINAFVTSTFSTVIYRFQDRVFWLLPATNAILIIKHYWYRFQVTPDNP